MKIALNTTLSEDARANWQGDDVRFYDTEDGRKLMVSYINKDGPLGNPDLRSETALYFIDDHGYPTNPMAAFLPVCDQRWTDKNVDESLADGGYEVVDALPEAA